MELTQPQSLSAPRSVTPENRTVALVFLGVVAFVFLCRTAFFWHDGQLLAGTHADEPFHYAAELVRLSPEHYPDDLSVQASLTLGEPYESFYGTVVWLVKRTGLSLMQVNFLICWTANAIYLAGLMLLLHRLGLSPWMCALGTVLASQRFALMAGQTLVAHGLAIPREVWQSLLPWFLFWFVCGARAGWRLVGFYGVLGAVYAATYALWAVELGLALGLVDLYRIIRQQNWRELSWLIVGAVICAGTVAAFNVGQFHQFGREESALFDRMQPGKAIYWSKGFRRFVLFSLLGWGAFRQLGWAEVKQQEPLLRLWRLWVVTTVICWIYQPLELQFRPLGLLYLGRLSLLNFLVSLVAVAVCVQQRFAGFRPWKKSVTMIGATLVCLFPLLSTYRGRLDLSFVSFCQWIKVNTPISGAVFVPPIEDAQFFRVYAERGMWIAPYDKTTLWTTRRLYALMQERVMTLKGFYQNGVPIVEREAVLKRLRQDGVDYVVTRTDAEWSAGASWPLVHQQGPWQLRAPPGGPPAGDQ